MKINPCKYCKTKITAKDIIGFGKRQRERIKNFGNFDYSAVWIHCPKCAVAMGVSDEDIQKAALEIIVRKWNG